MISVTIYLHSYITTCEGHVYLQGKMPDIVTQKISVPGLTYPGSGRGDKRRGLVDAFCV